MLSEARGPCLVRDQLQSQAEWCHQVCQSLASGQVVGLTYTYMRDLRMTCLIKRRRRTIPEVFALERVDIYILKYNSELLQQRELTVHALL